MQRQIRAEQFKGYPPLARELAAANASLFGRLPTALLIPLLREISTYDWKFPAERQSLDYQLSHLKSLSPADLDKLLGDLRKLQLSNELERANVFANPAEYSEKLTAYLWASHQIDAFRAAAVDYLKAIEGARPPLLPTSFRFGIVVIGDGVVQSRQPLFRKLRCHGTYFSNIDPAKGLQILQDFVAARAAAQPAPYAHWYLDGGACQSVSDGVTTVSYKKLEMLRNALLDRIEHQIDSGTAGPEALTAMLAGSDLTEFSPCLTTTDALLNHFQLSILTEGSGTQIFSTTFVQWASREALRRAQPLTLMAHFRPRQLQQPINELLSKTVKSKEVDPEGSLVDADMAGYYIWLNQQRLPGAELSKFLIWFENHGEAVVVAPLVAAGSEDRSFMTLNDLVTQMSWSSH